MITGFAVFYTVCAFILVLIALGSEHRQASADDSYRDKTPASKPGEVTCHMGDLFAASIGISILNLCDLDLSSKTFYAEGMSWLKYKELPNWLDHWDTDVIECPVRALRFVNNVNRHDLQLELEPSRPVVDSDGYNIQWLKFSGRFVANELDLRRFPFETIRLPIEIELEDMYASETSLRFEPSGSLVATGGNLTGYKLRGSDVEQSIHSYRTNWGWQLAVDCNGGEDLAEFDNVKAIVEYTRSTRSSLIGIFLPLAVMIAVVLSVPLIDIQQHENRVVIPASVLLVLVFLQDGYKKILPAGLSYPTLADLAYASCFVLTIGTFIFGLASANLYLSSGTASQSLVSSINSVSRTVFTLNLCFLVVSLSSILIATGNVFPLFRAGKFKRDKQI